MDSPSPFSLCRPCPLPFGWRLQKPRTGQTFSSLTKRREAQALQRPPCASNLGGTSQVFLQASSLFLQHTKKGKKRHSRVTMLGYCGSCPYSLNEKHLKHLAGIACFLCCLELLRASFAHRVTLNAQKPKYTGNPPRRLEPSEQKGTATTHHLLIQLQINPPT